MNSKSKLRLSYDLAKYILLITAFRIILDLTYMHVISVKFSYSGYKCDLNVFKTVISWGILGIFILQTYKYYKADRISSELLFVLFLLSVVPFTTMVAYYPFDFGFIIYCVVFWMFIFFLHKCFVKYKKYNQYFRNNNDQKNREKIFYIIAVLFSLVVIFVSGYYTNFRFNLNLDIVYELRYEARTYNMPTILRYVYNWTMVVMPIFIVYFLVKGNKFVGWLFFLIQIYNFSIEGSRTVLFLALAAIVIGHMKQVKLELLNKWILKGIVGVSLFGYILYKYNGNYVISSLVVRRVMFVPVFLNNCYYDFFKTHTPDFFRGGFLRRFGFETPYKDLDNIIGAIYWNSPQTNANNGLVGDAIANMGIAGAILYPILLTFTLRILDKSSNNLDSRVYPLAAIYIAMMLLNTFYFTTLLTHGLLITIVLFTLMKRNDKSKDMN